MMAWRRDATFCVGSNSSPMWAYTYLGGQNRYTFVLACWQILTKKFSSFTHFLPRGNLSSHLFGPITSKKAYLRPKKAYTGFGKLPIFFWWRCKIGGILS